ncbi:MAG: hypothetical protein ACOC6Q_02135 [Patescibacteria group bacterium]
MNKNLLLIFAAVGVLIAGGMLRTNTAQAETDNSYLQIPFVQELSQRLGISEEKVTTAMEEVRETRFQNDRLAQLDEAVADGVITETQKQMILDKQTEQNEQHEQHRNSMISWMEESGIDFEALREYGYGCGHACEGFGKGGCGMHKHGPKGW